MGKPPIADGAPLAPKDAFGHDHLWWLDMVRTSRPLIERMTLVWHDWFATSNITVGSQKLMLQQNQLFRQIGLGSFKGMLMRVTINPAMLLYLNGLNSIKGSPNENYGREMMELFTLGHDYGYTERDVRENARALTGWTADYKNNAGWVQVPLQLREPRPRHEGDLRQGGAFQLEELVRALHPAPEASRVLRQPPVELLHPVPPDPATATLLEQLYVHSGFQVRPVVAAILKHPLLYEGPRMVKSPVVYTAGMLRQRGDRIETADWAGRAHGRVPRRPSRPARRGHQVDAAAEQPLCHDEHAPPRGVHEQRLGVRRTVRVRQEQAQRRPLRPRRRVVPARRPR